MSCDVWPIRWPCLTSEADPDLVTLAHQAAQQTLWALAGRRHGTCFVVEAYAVPGGPCATPTPFHDAAGWHNGWWAADCCRIVLDHQPVQSVATVNGTTEGWHLERGVLRKVGGCWATSGLCDDGSVIVEYTWGAPINALGEMAVGEMACEFLRAFSGDPDCRLPSNAVSVNRNGITVDLENPAELYRQGRTGLPLSDAFIRAENPGHLPQRSRVLSPDVARRVT